MCFPGKCSSNEEPTKDQTSENVLKGHLQGPCLILRLRDAGMAHGPRLAVLPHAGHVWGSCQAEQLLQRVATRGGQLHPA